MQSRERLPSLASDGVEHWVGNRRTNRSVRSLVLRSTTAGWLNRSSWVWDSRNSLKRGPRVLHRSRDAREPIHSCRRRTNLPSKAFLSNTIDTWSTSWSWRIRANDSSSDVRSIHRVIDDEGDLQRDQLQWDTWSTYSNPYWDSNPTDEERWTISADVLYSPADLSLPLVVQSTDQSDS